jgi:hypothetical protein
MKEAGKFFSCRRSRSSYEKNARFLAAYIQGNHARLQYQSAKGTLTYDTASWMQLNRTLHFQTCCTDSGYPLVVMVQPTQYWNSDHLVSGRK